MSASAPLRAVLVEDSLVQRAHLARVLQLEGDIVVVAQAADADAALAAVLEHAPDVVTMDLQLPGGSGQSAIERIMAAQPVPILVLSGIIDGADALPAVEALAAGAVDALPKPLRWTADDERDLRKTVRALARVQIPGRAAPSADTPLPAARATPRKPVIGIAASTGGPAALTALLGGLERADAPILLVQQIHAAFIAGFVAWLAGATAHPVKLATEGEAPEAGTIYVAPGDAHLTLGADGLLHLPTEPEGAVRPSADVLFRSLADAAGPAATGVVLTGMGDDGASGLLALREAGGRTYAQDEASSTVFEMPQAAHAAGGVEMLLPPDRLANVVLLAVGERAA
jgi:two-component system chemotaxis response regulator CheB